MADEKDLRSLARTILRKIFGLVRYRGECRMYYNAALHELIEGHDNVQFMKAQRIKQLGHMEIMLVEWVPKTMLKWRLSSRRRDDHILDCWTMW